MPSINLNLAKEDIVEEKTGIISGSLVISIILLVLVGGLYGALKYYNKDVTSKIDEVTSQYNVEYQKFLSGNANEIIDFKNRTDIASALLDDDRPMNNVMAQIESSILPVVYLESLTYDKDKETITLSGVADSFNTVAKQILSFKQNDYFSSVIPGTGTMKEQNKLSFSLDLKIK